MQSNAMNTSFHFMGLLLAQLWFQSSTHILLIALF